MLGRELHHSFALHYFSSLSDYVVGVSHYLIHTFVLGFYFPHFCSDVFRVGILFSQRIRGICDLVRNSSSEIIPHKLSLRLRPAREQKVPLTTPADSREP